MPEPDSQPFNRYVVSVMSRDRVGIVRDITTALAPWEANIDFASQTVVQEYFTLILIVSFPLARAPEAVREVLARAGAAGELQISLMPCSDGPTAAAAAVSGLAGETDRFILTAVGGDQPGMVHELAGYLAGQDINITDLYGATTADDHFVVISELAVPRQLDLTRLQLDIEALADRIGLAVTLQHENIFRATNEITAPLTFH